MGQRVDVNIQETKMVTFRVIFFICTISYFSYTSNCEARRTIHQKSQGMTLAELLYSRLSPKVPPSTSPLPGNQYQYQLPIHVQDTSPQNIRPGTAYQNNLSDSFKIFPFNVLNSIVGFKKTIFEDVVSNPSVPHVINDIIDIKKN